MREQPKSYVAPGKTDRPTGSDIRSLRAMLRYLRPYRWAVLGAFLALLFTAGSILGIVEGIRTLIDEGLSKGDGRLFDRAFIMLLGITFALSLAAFARIYLVSWIGEHVVADLRRDVYAQVMKLSPAFFEVTRTGEILSRLMADTMLLQTVMGSTVAIALRNLLLLVAGFIALVITSAKLTAYVFLVMPAVIVPILLVGRRVRALSRQAQDRMADMSAHIEETVSGIRTVQAFCLEERESARFTQRATDVLAAAVRHARSRAMLASMVIAMVFGAVVVVLWVGGRDVMAGAVTPGDLSAFVLYSLVVANAVGSLSEIVGDLQRAAGATERLVELLETKPQITAPATPMQLPVPVKGAVEFEQVTFHYPAREHRSALEDIKLSIEPGETVALVGPSGAGKTTMFQLLLRFYDPQQGRVMVDGVDIRALEPRSLRTHIGLVSQEPVIFSANAWDNIRYGNPEASDGEVRAAAEAAAALEFLEKLPQGLDTYLGERGVKLSGGQRQRVAIARAILRNPRLLLLDEATSALDSENEKQVQTALERLMQNRTTLVIAHRLSTVTKAHRIVVMNEGKIEAVGTHQELLRRSELYARLAALQFNTDESKRVA